MACAFSLKDVTLFYSQKELLTHVDLTVSDGDRIGIVGRNGAGKSTLLRLLAGREEPDRGELMRRRGLSVAYLPQTPQLREEDTISQAALTYLPPRAGDDQAAVAYEAETMLTKLGFRDLNQPVSSLSGGQRMRVALAGVLCRQSDVLLLDEPTNHIDLQTTEWLEQQLLSWKGTLMVVTHDRYLLQRVFSRILQVGGGKVDSYQTDYAGYLQEQAQREEMEAATLRKNKALYRKELAWVRRGAPARSTKAKGRLDRFEGLTEAVKEAPPEQQLSMKSAASRLGRKIMSWEHLDAAVEGHVLLRDFSYTLLRDDRVGIVGANGTGKTTLLRTLAGQLPLGAGTMEVGDTVKVGYFAQHVPPLKEDMRVIDAVRDAAVIVRTPEGDLSASQMAETFLFPSGMQYQLVSSLSGGERRRLHLLRILMTAPNVLILDEPTNDLDLQTLNVLEDYLDAFKGALIVVSHDRYFLDRVTTHAFAIHQQRMVHLNDGYRAWLELLEQEQGMNEPPKPAPASQKAQKKENAYDLRLSFKEQRDLETIDERIAGLEETLKQLETELAENASDYARVTELMARQEQTNRALEEAMDRWVYLQEKVERIAQAGR